MTKKSLSASDRAAADAYAGPGHAFPLYSSGAHLRAAWDLAGHAADPSAVRAKIRAFADAHNLSHLLPDDAETKKANDSKVRRLLDLAFHHESLEGDTAQKLKLIAFAQSNGLSDALPPDAHALMHDAGVPHGHPGDAHDGMPNEHEHTIQKAINVVSKSITIAKSYEDDQGNSIIEGWSSTEDQDMEQDIVPPECFTEALEPYMARKGPLSSEHNMQNYPIGHAQRIALVRDGQIFKSATHPDDPAEFEHFPGTGTGMYGRYCINDSQAAGAVKKGNVGGFSWVGNLREYTPLPGGGRRFIRVDPLRESTIAAYPVNSKAVLLAVKAFEADLQTAAKQGDSLSMEDNTLEQLLQGAAAAVEREDRAEQTRKATEAGTITKTDLEGLLTGFSQKILSEVDARIQKAAVVREDGAGRVGVETNVDPRETDPASYIVKKAREIAGTGTELTPDDKELAWGITFSLMGEGMRD